MQGLIHIFILNDIALPKIHWVLQSDKIEIESSIKPQKVKLWFCHNDMARDFRFITSYSYWHLLSRKVFSVFLGKLCDNCYTEEIINFVCQEDSSCKIVIPLPVFKNGWLAAFAEMHYDINHVPFVVTTEVDIVPDAISMPMLDKEDL